jgi:hypothetical protein
MNWRRQIACGTILMLAVCGLRAQEQPRSLPAPEVPVTELPGPAGPALEGPKIDRPVSAPRGASESAPYSGPPAGIDGPQRLPPPGIELLPGETIGPEELVPFTDSPLGEILPGAEYYSAGQKLSPYKSGFFQKLSLSAAWFGDGGDPQDLGATEIETFLTVALPAPIREWPLLISPGYNVAYLQGPHVSDLPPRLHFAYVDFLWVPQIYHRYKLLLAVAPSVLSDFEGNNSDAFRLTGKGLVVFDWVPDRLQLVAGVL